MCVEGSSSALEVSPFVLGLLAVGLGVDGLVVVVGLHFLLLVIVVVLDHAEHAQERVAYDAEGLRFFLVLLAYLELYVLDGRGVPIGGVIDQRGGIFDQ